MTPEQKAEVSRLRKEAYHKRKASETKQQSRDDEPVNDRHGDMFGRAGQESSKKQKTGDGG